QGGTRGVARVPGGAARLRLRREPRRGGVARGAPRRHDARESHPGGATRARHRRRADPSVGRPRGRRRSPGGPRGWVRRSRASRRLNTLFALATCARYPFPVKPRIPSRGKSPMAHANAIFLSLLAAAALVLGLAPACSNSNAETASAAIIWTVDPGSNSAAT